MQSNRDRKDQKQNTDPLSVATSYGSHDRKIEALFENVPVAATISRISARQTCKIQTLLQHAIRFSTGPLGRSPGGRRILAIPLPIYHSSSNSIHFLSLFPITRSLSFSYQPFPTHMAAFTFISAHEFPFSAFVSIHFHSRTIVPIHFNSC